MISPRQSRPPARRAPLSPGCHAVVLGNNYKVFQSATFGTATPGSQDSSSLWLQAAAPLLKEISKNTLAAEEETFEDPEELDQSTPRSRSLMEQAAEGVRALGSFFAQAAMGGAEVCCLLLL